MSPIQGAATCPAARDAKTTFTGGSSSKIRLTPDATMFGTRVRPVWDGAVSATPHLRNHPRQLSRVICKGGHATGCSAGRRTATRGTRVLPVVDEEQEETGWTGRSFRARVRTNPARLVNSSDYAIGQAIFVRTDTPDYEEEGVPFKNLSELVQICSHPRPDMILEKVIVYAMPGGEPHAVTLSFLSSSKGEKPGNLDLAGLEDQ